MKYGYAIFLFIMVLILVYRVMVIRKLEQTGVVAAIGRLHIVAALTTLMYAATIVMPSENAAILFYSLYFLTSDFLLFTFLIYAERYTELLHPSKLVHALVYLGIFADIVCFAYNLKSGLVFGVTEAGDGTGNTFFAIGDRGVMYRYHRVLIYAMTIMIIVSLFVSIVRTPRIYRKKGIAILHSFIIVIAANVCYLLFKFPLDFSLVFYALISMSVYYFSLCYVPKRLVERMLAHVVRNMQDGILCFDMDGRCLYANTISMQAVHADGDMSAAEEYYQALIGDRDVREMPDSEWDADVEIDGEIRYFHTWFKRLLDEKGSYIGCFFVMHDRTEDIRQYKFERYCATHDRLTGLYNREYFYERVSELLQEQPNEKYSMVCTDIKDFKMVNDVFGREKGDEILRKIADMLREFADEDTVYGRLSSDHFAICMRSDSLDVESFFSKLKEIGKIAEGISYRARMYVGICEIQDVNTPVSVLCDYANLALKGIKGNYRQSVAYYDNNLRKKILKEQHLVSDFNQALALGQFQIFLQPQTSLDGKVYGAEALVRWFHPVSGMLVPKEFAGILEQTGLIGRLDAYVWELACRQLKVWKEKKGYEGYYISVNIYQKDFYFMDVYETLTGLVERYEIDAKRLRLEITEDVITNDAGKRIMLLERLREYGFFVDIDGFGGGYSSLNMLQDIHVDALKIDMDFIRESGDPERNRTILQMVTALAKELGMKPIPEGVENKEQADYLAEIGCDIFQGNYFAKPMRIEDFERTVES